VGLGHGWILRTEGPPASCTTTARMVAAALAAAIVVDGVVQCI
jgi:hypothetical protein